MGARFSLLTLHLTVWLLPILFVALLAAHLSRVSLATRAAASPDSLAATCFFALLPPAALLLCGRYSSADALWAAPVTQAGVLWVNVVLLLLVSWSVAALCCWVWKVYSRLSYVLLTAPLWALPLWVSLAFANSYLCFFLILELASLALVAVVLSLTTAYCEPDHAHLRAVVYLLWSNACSFILFFFSLAVGAGSTLVVDWSAISLLVQVGGTLVGGQSGWVYFFFFSLTLKLLLPPVQFILVILYKGLPFFCLPYYFSFYYVFVLAATLALFFVNLVTVTQLWMAPASVGALFVLIGLLQVATQPASFSNFLALSTALNLGLILAMCASA